MVVNFTPAAFKYYPMYFMKAYPLGEWRRGFDKG
jgi:hypothetical protein